MLILWLFHLLIFFCDIIGVVFWFKSRRRHETPTEQGIISSTIHEDFCENSDSTLSKFETLTKLYCLSLLNPSKPLWL